MKSKYNCAVAARRDGPAHGAHLLQPAFLSRRTFGPFVLVLASLLSIQTVYGKFPSQDAPVTFESLVKSAAAARESGKYGDAIRDYKQALELRPEWIEGWWDLGTLQYDSDEYAEAIRSFQNLVQLAPGARPGWSFLGLCEFEIKDYANSMEDLKKGMSLGEGDDPELTRVAKYHLSLLLIRSGSFDEAGHLLVTAFGQNQVSVQVKTALGLALLRVPLLPEEIDASRDALVQAAGEVGMSQVRNDIAKALEKLPALLKDHPNVPYLHYAYGRALFSADRLEDAARELRDETRVSPESGLVRVEMSRVLLRMRRPQEAVRSAEEAVKLAPDSSEAHLALGQALKALKKDERSAQELAAAEKLVPEKPQPEKRIAHLYGQQSLLNNSSRVQATAMQGNTTVAEGFDELSRRAAEAQQAGNAPKAIEAYQKALQLHPEWQDGRWNLAMLCFSAARYPEAIASLKIFVERKPAFGTAWAVMGLSEFETRDFKNALIHLERGEELGFGGSAESVRIARLRLATLLNQDGQFERAMQTLAPETVSSPLDLDKEVQLVLGVALLRMRLLPEQIKPAKNSLIEAAGEVAALLQNSKYDLAFTRFDLLLKEYPGIPFLHYAFGTALLALSRYDEAEKQIREELKISPQSELPYLRLASLALKRRQPAEALPLAQRAAQIAADSAEAHYVWGRASFDLGQNETAVRELESASRLSPGSPEVHFNLAKAYVRAKLPEKAEKERNIFAHLNALAEQQRSQSGNQAYGAHNAADVSPTRTESAKPTPQHP
jgi:tetratricopeptide (TPR) repeat protein